MYWVLFKKENKPGIYKNAKALSEATGVPVRRLYHYFSRPEPLKYEDEEVWIERFRAIKKK
jgi:hypothetical protein